MENIPSDLAKTVLEKMIDGAIAESRYLCCFTSIAEECEKEKEELTAKGSTVEEFVKVANRRVKNIRSDVMFWQKKAEDLIGEDTKTKMRCFFGLCPNCIWQYRRGKELANKTEEIRKLIKQSSEFQSVGIDPDLPGVEYYSSQDYICFKSRALKHKELLDALEDDRNYIIGLKGMGGTGKTTLAKQVGKELEHLKRFDRVIDATVSYTPDIKRIQDEIAAPLGLASTLKDCNVIERRKLLRTRLTNGDKILVLLDDVWGHINFEEIGIPSNDNNMGCRVLLTTRNVWVCNLMGCERIIHLDLLSDEDAWTLFKKHAGVTDSASKRLLDLGRKINKECKGLPIAIATIASSLKGQNRQEDWNAALISLRKPVPMQGVDENLVEIFKRLRYSYDQLKNEKAKKLFLLCSMFPEDTEIPTETLTRFGIGVGLFGEVEDQYDEVRNQVVATINKLIDSCLLLKAREGCVKMHDLVREVALWIANKEIQLVDLSKKGCRSLVEREENIKYLSCGGKWMDIFSCRINGPKLEILNVCMDEDGDKDECLEVSSSFFEHVRGLRVLCLTNNNRRNLDTSSLDSTLVLTNLRSLSLKGLELGDISVLGKLPSLETLELVRCGMVELPSEFSESKKLLLLKLEKCVIERMISFEGCSSLEELYIVYHEDIPWHPIKTLPALQRYLLCSSDSYVSSQNASKCVDLSRIDALFSEAALKYLVQTAEMLWLSRIGGKRTNLIPEIVSIDEGMNDLIELRLEFSSQIQCLIDTRHVDCHGQKNVFSKLVALKLVGMRYLEELYRGPLPAHDFLKTLERVLISQCENLNILFKRKLNLCSLKIIELSNCLSLVSLFQLSTCRSLVVLEELRIRHCKQLKSIIADEEEESRQGVVDDTNTRCPMLPNLKTLNIQRCSRVEFVLQFLSAQDVPALEHVTVEDCFKLKYIFEHQYKNHHQEVAVLGSLKSIILNGVPNFIHIFPNSSPVKSFSSKPEIRVDPIPIKRSIFSWTRICCHADKNTQKHKSTTTSTCMASVSKDQQQHYTTSSDLSGNMNHFATLEKVLLRRSKVENIFCLNESFTLQNLRGVSIARCNNLKVIFSNYVVRCLPQLETLIIEECAALKQIISEDVENHETMSDSISPKTCCFPKLTLLVVKKCNELKCVFPLSTWKEFPKLEFVIITEASELTQVFGCECHQKVELPNLEFVLFANLGSLCQGIEFQTAKYRFVKDCPKLCLTSTSTTLKEFKDLCYSACRDHKMDKITWTAFENTIDELQVSRTQDTSKKNSNVESSAQSKSEPQVQPKPKKPELTSSQRDDDDSQVENSKDPAKSMVCLNETHAPDKESKAEKNMSNENPIPKPIKDNIPKDESICELSSSHDEQSKGEPSSMNQNQPPGGFKTRQGVNDQSIEGGSVLEEIVPSTLPTNSETKSKPTQEEERGKVHGSEISSKTISPTDSELIRGRCPNPLDTPMHKTSSHDHLRGTENQSIEETLPTNSEAHNILHAPLQKGIERNTEEGTASTHWKSLSSSPLVSTYPKEVDVDVSHSRETSKSAVNLTETNASDDGTSMKANSITKEKFPIVNNMEVLEPSKSSPAIPFTASHSSTMPLKGDTSQFLEDPSFTSQVTRELEQLVYDKHLTYDNLFLLKDFLVKHPSVRLKESALSNKYKSCAYSYLVELLKFLQTHSVLDVQGSSHSKFVELLQDVRSFGFDKDWVDDVEKRALHPGLQFSKDALQKKLESKKHATKEVDGLSLKIDILTQHVEELKLQLASSKAALENIIQNEAQMLEAWAGLSAPLGY